MIHTLKLSVGLQRTAVLGHCPQTVFASVDAPIVQIEFRVSDFEGIAEYGGIKEPDLKFGAAPKVLLRKALFTTGVIMIRYPAQNPVNDPVAVIRILGIEFGPVQPLGGELL